MRGLRQRKLKVFRRLRITCCLASPMRKQHKAPLQPDATTPPLVPTCLEVNNNTFDQQAESNSDYAHMEKSSKNNVISKHDDGSHQTSDTYKERLMADLQPTLVKLFDRGTMLMRSQGKMVETLEGLGKHIAILESNWDLISRRA